MVLRRASRFRHVFAAVTDIIFCLQYVPGRSNQISLSCHGTWNTICLWWGQGSWWNIWHIIYVTLGQQRILHLMGAREVMSLFRDFPPETIAGCKIVFVTLVTKESVIGVCQRCDQSSLVNCGGGRWLLASQAGEIFSANPEWRKQKKPFRMDRT